MCVIGTIYLIAHVFILPLAYIKAVFIKLQMVFQRRSETKLWVRLLWLAIIVCAGPFIILLNFIVDCGVFVVHCFQQTLTLRREQP